VIKEKTGDGVEAKKKFIAANKTADKKPKEGGYEREGDVLQRMANQLQSQMPGKGTAHLRGQLEQNYGNRP